MAEALSILFVMIVAGIVYFAISIQMKKSSGINSPKDLARLTQHEGWLRERLERAQRENWTNDMIASLAAELHATSQQLAKANAPES